MTEPKERLEGDRGRPAGPSLKKLKIPSPGHLTKLVSIEQKTRPKGANDWIYLELQDQDNNPLGVIDDMSGLRKIWAMAQEAIKSREHDEPTVWALMPHFQSCPRCGRYIKWREYYLKKKGPDPKKKNRFRLCYVCAEGTWRERQRIG